MGSCGNYLLCILKEYGDRMLRVYEMERSPKGVKSGLHQ